MGDGDGEEDSATGTASSLEEDYQKTVEKVLPSIVQITTEEDLGSGIVYDDSGHIVTNAHVVGEAKEFEVTPAAGGDTVKASLVASYPPNDLAVIKLEKSLDLPVAKFADSADTAVGDMVLAMGNPLGLSGSVSQGIVSATGRTVKEPRSKTAPEGATIPDMIQTTAAINPGNSGGALVNLSNEVVGIPTLAATDPDSGDSAAPGIGFAIPSSAVTRLADQIIKDGEVTDSGRAALNIEARNVVSSSLKPEGVGVVAVKKGGAAAKGGVEVDDVIVQIDDTAITTVSSLNEFLAGKAPGDKVKITVDRGGSEEKLTVTLGEL
nr:trypsin-like peptidase domain-containing protein [Stackebrandtia nassauensis]